MAKNVLYDRKSGLLPNKSILDDKQQIPDATVELTNQKTDEIRKYVIFGIVLYFLCMAKNC